MANIPGLMVCPVDDVSGDGIELPTFNSRTVIPESHRFGNCRTVNDFEKLGKLSEGQFGIIYKSREKRTGEIFILKKLRMPAEFQDGIPSSILREINILNTLKHTNIVNSHGTVAGKNLDSNYLVMDYCAFSLEDLIGKNIDTIFDISVVKCIMKQLFQGLEYIHGGLIIHRDINCQNIQFHESGILKITGFRASRFYSKGNMTPGVSELSYRAPELLFQAKIYGSAIDMWSAGCVFARLLLKKLLFSGDSELEVLSSIFDVLGTPSENIWPGFAELLSQMDNGNDIIENGKLYTELKSYFVDHSATCKDMIQDLLLYYPTARLSAQECLKSPYFAEEPLECSDKDLALMLRKIASSAGESMQID